VYKLLVQYTTQHLQMIIFMFRDLLLYGMDLILFMSRCAGVCSYEGHGGLCSIRLSEPLLKLRPRKDLVETLLVSFMITIYNCVCACSVSL